MLIWTGLGNPGAKYAGNRHNIGFMALERIAADHGFSGWKRGFQGLVAEGRLGGEKLLLLKPETFMNLSGQAVGEALRFHKLGPDALTVFHDELDLAPGRVRLKQGGGHAGHNGLRSIHAHVGEAYARVRLGIGHPGHKDAVAAYVLHDFAKADQDWLDDLLRGISDGAGALAAGEGPKFLNAIQTRMQPERVKAPAPAQTPLKPPVAEAPGRAPREVSLGALPSRPAATEAPPAREEAAPEKTALQRLMEKFR